MPATDEQRSWLEKAISEKGRLTRKNSIKKDFEKYIRRRDKVEAAVAALGWNSKENEVKNNLKAADKEAEDGHFSKAYKHLDAVKKQARALAIGRGNEIEIEELDSRIAFLDKTIRNRVVLNNLIKQNLQGAVDDLKGFEKAKDQTNLDDAIKAWSAFNAEEPRIKSKVDEAHKFLARLTAECKRPDMNNEPDGIQGQFVAIEFAGRENEFSALRARFDKVMDIYNADSDTLKNDSQASGLLNRQTLAYEKAVLEIKDMSAWQKRDGADVSSNPDDAEKFGIRDNVLNTTDNRLALLKAEEARFKWAEAQVQKERKRDRSLKPQRGKRGDVDLTPEPVPFSGAAVFGDLVAMDEKLPDVVTDQKASELQQAAADKLKAFIATADAKGDEMFDLSLKSSGDFKKMLCEELFGTTSTKGLTDTQVSLLNDAAKTLEKTLVAEIPNKMKDDGSEISIGGETYTFVETIKSGGNGMARRYKSGGKTIVVKTMLDPGAVEEMKSEMKLHRRAMNGIDTDDPEDSAIVNMKGAALSEKDGEVQVHMVMEDVDGGDLTDMTNSMAIMTSMGMIPEAARQVLSLEMLAQTTKALMELERQGLVHHDIKGENVMMTADGKIKIIDYGESHFGDKDGVVRGARGSGTTAGYAAPEANSKEYDTSVDAFALGGMIERMVARMSPSGKNDFKSGAMGKMIKQLKSADPKERPSLEAVLMSSLMQSNRTDYAEGDIEDLQEASNEMAILVAKEKVTVDREKLIAEIPRAGEWVNGDEVKLKTLQDVAESLSAQVQQLEQKYAKDSDGYLTTGKREIEELKRQRTILEKGLIKKAINDKAANGKKAMDDAIEDKSIKIEYAVRNSKKSETLKDAIASRDKIVKFIGEAQEKFYQNLSQTDVDMSKVQSVNDRLTELDEIRKSIDKAIYDAVGSDAKFYLSKVKVEDISKRFGPSTAPREQPEIEEDQLGDLLATLIKSKEEAAVRQAARPTGR